MTDRPAIRPADLADALNRLTIETPYSDGSCFYCGGSSTQDHHGDCPYERARTVLQAWGEQQRADARALHRAHRKAARLATDWTWEHLPPGYMVKRVEIQERIEVEMDSCVAEMER